MATETKGKPKARAKAALREYIDEPDDLTRADKMMLAHLTPAEAAALAAMKDKIAALSPAEQKALARHIARLCVARKLQKEGEL